MLKLKHVLGFLPRMNTCIWINTCSLGETKSAGPLLEALRSQYPSHQILLTVHRRSGYNYANTHFSKWAAVTHHPFDLPGLTNLAIKRVNPTVLIVIENLIWPFLFNACRKRKIPVLLVNAKIGLKSAQRYQRFQKIARWVFRSISLILVSSKKQHARFSTLPVEKIERVGELKLLV